MGGRRLILIPQRPGSIESEGKRVGKPRSRFRSAPKVRESQHCSDDFEEYHFGVDTLARNKDVHWTLELVGDGPLRREIEQLTAQLGLLDRVQFTGTRRDVPERLAKAQILALISRWEGFPLTVIEGMRAGFPQSAPTWEEYVRRWKMEKMDS